MKAYLQTFGCRANQYDSEAMRRMLRESGVTFVQHPDEADVALFNSCAVTAAAEAELRQAIRRVARRNTRLRTVVTGCAAAVDRGALRELPSVQHVIGGADLPAVAEALGLAATGAGKGAESRSEHERGSEHEGASEHKRASELERASARQTSTRALLRIQDGCDEHCTFCITTLARGKSRSRPMAELAQEARILAQYHPEIVITGIHIGGYGRDIGTSLGALMQRLVDEIPDIRFRLSSLEATEVDATLRHLFATAPDRLAPYLHAPLQSGSDPLLKRMGRHWYTAESYADAVTAVVGGRPVFGLSADVIAGFPGETDADHAATMALIQRLPFTALHVFPFSLRPGTPAERLPDPVPSTVINERAKALRELGQAKASAYRHRRAGSVADIIAIGSGNRRAGVTEDYLTIPVDPSTPRGTRFRGVVPA